MEGNNTKEKPTVLYVDDEPQNLVSFRASFRKVYRVITANSGFEALDILQKEADNISIVISDQRMPKMTGVELLEKVRESYPDIMRIVLTGYSDIQDIINAISRGEVYRYITKPWNRDELKLTIDNAIEAYDLKKENKRLFKDLKVAYSQLEEDAKMLEIKVSERTKELQEQKEELFIAHKNIQKQQHILQKQNQELVELDSEKNHLIGIVAHDLKTPISQISGIVELMALDEDEMLDEHREYIKEIQKSLSKQEEMITQILDLNKLDSSDTSKLDITNFNLGDVILEVSQRFNLTAKKKGITIVNQISSEGAEIESDENYVTHIFQNLISNAIKFSDSNSKVTVSLTSHNNELVGSVKDEGPGLNEDDKMKLFGRFQKLSARPTGGEHSTGLGLSIVKKMVDALHGKVWVESEVGHGAEFIVSLPKG